MRNRQFCLMLLANVVVPESRGCRSGRVDRDEGDDDHDKNDLQEGGRVSVHVVMDRKVVTFCQSRWVLTVLAKTRERERERERAREREKERERERAWGAEKPAKEKDGNGSSKW
jgi:hypothetical protein